MQTVITQYRDLARWDVKSFLLFSNIGADHVRLGTLLRKKQNQWNGTDDAPMLSLHFGGEFSQRESNQIKGQLFVADKGDLVYSKIDLRNGAIGIIPSQYSRALFTAEFPIYEIDTNVIHPVYLQLYLQSLAFKNLINSIVSGASGRKRVKPTDFENLYILVPAMKTQEGIVNDWNKAQMEAQELKTAADKLEFSIDDLILSELGMKKINTENNNTPFTVRFQDLERWDTYFYRKDFYAMRKQLNFIKSDKLGNKASFITRGWKKNDFPSGSFRYIQIGDVNKSNGIQGFVNTSVSEAPSRATQIIKEGDIIISTTRPYLAAFSEVNAEYDGCVASSGFSVIEKTESDLDQSYLLEFLKSSGGLKQIEQRMTGASYPAITQEELEKIMIPLPPINTQREIVKKVTIMRKRAYMLRLSCSNKLQSAKADIEKAII